VERDAPPARLGVILRNRDVAAPSGFAFDCARVQRRLRGVFDLPSDDGDRGEYADKKQNAMYRAPHTDSFEGPQTRTDDSTHCSDMPSISGCRTVDSIPSWVLIRFFARPQVVARARPIERSTFEYDDEIDTAHRLGGRFDPRSGWAI
jgi:hypothetical protein